jgi:hypothetical protein
LLERGDREVVTARLPAVVRLQADALRLPYIARARVHAVAGLPIERYVLEGPPRPSGLDDGPLQMARPRTRLGQQQAPAATSAAGRLQALMGAGAARAPQRPTVESAPTPERMAEEFVRYLAHHGLLAKR